MKAETVPFILEVPVLDDEAVDAVHSFMVDLLTQFENHYFGQLHRHQQHLASLRREAGNQGGPLDTDTELDEDLNDEVPS